MDSSAAEQLWTLLRDLVREEVRAALAEQRRPAPAPTYLTVRDAAGCAGVAPTTIRRWIQEGSVPGYGAGRGLRVRCDDLEAYLDSRRGSGTGSVELTDTEIDRMAVQIEERKALRRDYLSAVDVADLVGLSVESLKQMRARAEGPPYHRVGRRAVRYARADVETWLASRRVGKRR